VVERVVELIRGYKPVGDVECSRCPQCGAAPGQLGTRSEPEIDASVAGPFIGCDSAHEMVDLVIGLPQEILGHHARDEHITRLSETS
jgi:hypothetical protein